MTDQMPSAFDALEDGPRPSDEGRQAPPRFPAAESDHPTIVALGEAFGDAIIGQRTSAGDQHVVWIDPTRNFEILRWLKEDPAQAYTMMSDVTAIDYGNGRPVEVVYQMFSIRHKQALRVRAPLALDNLEIDSIAPLWQTADWLEREVYDMFGVTFKGHPDLRRILMPYDYDEGYPLRKDFPLRGRYSRAEQTRRALNQDLERYYLEDTLAEGREAQEAPDTEPPELEDAGGER